MQKLCYILTILTLYCSKETGIQTPALRPPRIRLRNKHLFSGSLALSRTHSLWRRSSLTLSPWKISEKGVKSLRACVIRTSFHLRIKIPFGGYSLLDLGQSRTFWKSVECFIVESGVGHTRGRTSSMKETSIFFFSLSLYFYLSHSHSHCRCTYPSISILGSVINKLN